MRSDMVMPLSDDPNDPNLPGWYTDAKIPISHIGVLKAGSFEIVKDYEVSHNSDRQLFLHWNIGMSSEYNERMSNENIYEGRLYSKPKYLIYKKG